MSERAPEAATISPLANVAAIATLLLFVLGALYQQLVFSKIIPLGSDYTIYAAAAAALERGRDPYVLANVATAIDGGEVPYEPVDPAYGFLYPPPSLWLILGFERLGSAGFSGRAIFLSMSIAAALAGVWLLSRTRDRRAATPDADLRASLMAALCLTSAGLIESLQCGQINTLVFVCVAGLWWARSNGRPYLGAALLAVAICLKATPVVFAALFVAALELGPLLAMVGLVALAHGLAEIASPVPHLTRSFVEALLATGSATHDTFWNNALPASGAAQIAKLAVLLALLAGAVIATWRGRHGAAGAHAGEAPLFVACTVTMVLAPNLVWLHHTALLIPAFWLLGVVARGRVIHAAVVIAMALMQGLRFYQWQLDRTDSLPFLIAQIVLVLAAAAFVWK